MKKLVSVFCCEWRSILVGALSFWFPDVIYHYLLKAELTRVAILELTFLMPLVTAICWLAIRTWKKRSEARREMAIFMLLGIWLLGPLMITLGTTFAGAGFKAGLISVVIVFIGTLVFPLYTSIMSGLDLTIPPLAFVTLFLVSIHFWEKRHSAIKSDTRLDRTPFRSI